MEKHIPRVQEGDLSIEAIINALKWTQDPNTQLHQQCLQKKKGQPVWLTTQFIFFQQYKMLLLKTYPRTSYYDFLAMPGH